LVHEKKLTQTIHQLQEFFYKCKEEEGEDIVDFLEQLEIIIKQLKGMNNNNFNDLTMTTKVLHNLPNNLKHFRLRQGFWYINVATFHQRKWVKNS